MIDIFRCLNLLVNSEQPSTIDIFRWYWFDRRCWISLTSDEVEGPLTRGIHLIFLLTKLATNVDGFPELRAVDHRMLVSLRRQSPSDNLVLLEVQFNNDAAHSLIIRYPQSRFHPLLRRRCLLPPDCSVNARRHHHRWLVYHQHYVKL